MVEASRDGSRSACCVIVVVGEVEVGDRGTVLSRSSVMVFFFVFASLLFFFKTMVVS